MLKLLNPALPFIAMALAVVAGLALSWLLRKTVLKLNRKRPELQATSRVARQPLRLALCLVGVRIALGLTAGSESWHAGVDHLLLIALIGAVAWLAIAVLLIVEAVVLNRHSVEVADNRRARRLRTQMILARRIAVALVVVLAVGTAMLTFPAIQALGAGLLASAGVISIVAGLAAQTSLVNVFAGMQLAFTDAIRVDDVVVVQKEWGRIEEITLTYVVVHLWDDRRLILPSTHFTTTPFENWTRRQSEVMGTVEFDLDWRAPVEDMRTELRRVLAGTELWDERVGVLQITDATGGFVRIRILVSAADSAALFDLRCLVRETMVTFLQQNHPEALPHQRWEHTHDAGTASQRKAPLRRPGASGSGASPAPADPHESQLFTGSIEAVERSRAFTGPGEEVFEERDRNLASRN
ncbi:mechanosensitive ion channel family protein [Pseudarthrobacter enclensis]|uniref:Small-conductance mechanosensitive channel n=1 Tax=Pseudarthrobacter enclensis TaxID=993070 RepID=A0ABT9S1D8_9MICC|nr:mechanosensitive ion channel domain-containing protein [Pseudarthrobacter enclensis]MDP9890339.1 small-conductance mechanosensitive channel [Pseudarthrobacter enclensis]